MKALSVFIFTLFLTTSVYTTAKDTTKVKYVHSYLSINEGYEHCFAPSFSVLPWFASHGNFASVSGFKAIKESYFGITGMAWYSRAYAFGQKQNGTYVLLKNDTVNPEVSSYSEGTGGYYQFFSAMCGIGLKLPEHTTRYAFEIRAMMGPIISQMPSISYTTTYLLPPFYMNTQNIYTQIQSTTAVSWGVDAGVGFGYKLSNNWGVICNCDVFFTSITFNSTITNSPETSNAYGNNNIQADLNCITVTGGVVYTFGKMIGDFVY